MLETDRLILRQWSDNDLAPFSEINRNKEVMEHFPSILTHKETVKFYKRIVSEFSELGIGLYALELKSDGKFIGYTGFHHFDFDAEFSPGIEIGWRLDMPPRQQKPVLIMLGKGDCSVSSTHSQHYAITGQNESCRKSECSP